MKTAFFIYLSVVVILFCISLIFSKKSDRHHENDLYFRISDLFERLTLIITAGVPTLALFSFCLYYIIVYM